GKKLPEDEGGLKKLNERATMPELLGWLERNPQRAAQITPEEADELLSMEGGNSPPARLGVPPCAELGERERRLLPRVSALARTEYVDLLEQLVGLMFDKIQPPRNAA